MSRKERRAAASAGKGGPRAPSASGGIDALFSTAFRHHKSGQLAEAERLYWDVLAVEPRHAHALHFLGVLRHQAGDSGAAVELIGQAIAVNSAIPDFHFNLGVIFEALGRRDDAAARYLAVTALKPDHFGASLNLGNVLLGQGKLGEAEAACRRAVALAPQSGDAHYNLGNALARQQRYGEAVAQFADAARLNPDFAAAHGGLGAALLATRDFGEAAKHLRRALALDPRNHQVALNLGHAELAQGHEADALEVALHALDIEESREAKELFRRAVRHARATSDAPRFRDLIARALEEGWDNPANLVSPAVSLIKLNPAVKAAIDRIATSRPAPLSLEQLMGLQGLGELARDRVLCRLLAVAPVCDAELERFLTALRHALLDVAAAQEALPAGGLEVFCALAQQCFVNEYVYAWSEAERHQVAALGDRLAAALAHGEAISPLWIPAVAAYHPLDSLAGAERLPERPWPAPVVELLARQITQPRIERELRAGLPHLSAVEDAVSVAVKQQYEENPYPRWIDAGAPGPAIPLDAYLQAKFPAAGYRPLGNTAISVLIAGCGSGQHAIETAQRFAGVDVLAIDLSTASLAYALRKTRELGLANLHYGVADILTFDAAGRSFDVIEASGVLHHLADPMAAWRRLLSMLRPGGVMNVGLYSELARADVVRAREFVAAHVYSATPDGIRQCRQEMTEVMVAASGDALLTAAAHRADFFSLSGCRDLLFHVQEHRMTLPQIAAFIADAGLVFLGFDAEISLLEQYAARFPADTAKTDLASWHRFEIENPGSFAAMYQFWVQKR
jgi:tetratricopeptide (TPR) repeat protein/SAM-dependent methyltransferase